MGKRRCFLGFLVSLCVFIFSANSFAEDGYTCTKEYTSCSKINYYLDNGQCRECPSGEGWESTAQEATATFCTCPENYRNSESETGDTTVTAGQTCVLATVTITVDKNGGTGSLSAHPLAGDGDEPVVKSNSGTDNAEVTCVPGTQFYFTGITKTGYTLNGFSESQSATSGDTTIECPSSSTTLYAIWNPIKYYVTYDFNGSSCHNGDTPGHCPSEVYYNDLPIPQNGGRDGFFYVHYYNKPAGARALTGWKVTGMDNSEHYYAHSAQVDPDVHGPFTDTSWESVNAAYFKNLRATPNTVANPVHFEAIWECQGGYSGEECSSNTLNLHFKSDYGTTPTTPANCVYDTKVTMPSAITGVDGYEFVGWSVDNWHPDREYFNANEEIDCNYVSFGKYDGTVEITAVWRATAGSCTEGEYFDSEDGECKSCSDETGTEFPHSESGQTGIESCYKMATPTCTQNACTNPDTTGCSAVECAASCTCSGMEQYKLYYGGTPITRTCTKAVASLTAKPNYYTSVPGSCPLCADYDPYFNESDGGENISESDCYHTCTAEDIPYAVEFENNPIYYGGDGEWCRASLCEENYYLADGVCIDCPDNATCDGSDFDCDEGYHKNEDGTACVPDDGVIYYVCHYVHSVGNKLSYDFCPKGALSAGCTLESIVPIMHAGVNECTAGDVPTDPLARLQWLRENCEIREDGTTGQNITLSDKAYELDGFTYDFGCSVAANETFPSVSCGMCTHTEQTTVLPDGSRMIMLFYNRDKYSVELTKGTGIDSVTGDGEYDYEQLVNINATKADGYSWKNWTDNNNNNAVVSTRQSYSFNMPHTNLSYRANATVYSGYTITYDLNGGTWPTGATYPSTYSINDSFTITNPVRDNYSFTGWTITTAPTAWGSGSSATGAKNFHVAAGTYGNFALKANWEQSTLNCKAGFKDEAGEIPCERNHYCPGGNQSVSTGCQFECPALSNGASTAGNVTAPSSPAGSETPEACFVTFTCEPVYNSNHVEVGGGDSICNYAIADGTYSSCSDVDIKYCSAGYYHKELGKPICDTVGAGAWSPGRADPNSCAEDLTSKRRYSCNDLVDGVQATTTGATSESASQCLAECTDAPITHGTKHSTQPVAFTGNITSYNPASVNAEGYADFTASGGFAQCTYDQIRCFDGYHQNGDACEPNIYEFRLNKNGGANGDNGPIYMKYGEGWYSNASATVSIANINLPTKDTETCQGYMFNGAKVINERGEIKAEPTIVNGEDYSTPRELKASWEVIPKTECEAGTYYDAETKTCKECPDGYYCPAGEYYEPDDDTGLIICPELSATNYTPAQSWDKATNTLSPVSAIVHSDNGRATVTDCFTTVKYTAGHGAGRQDCYYDKNRQTYNSTNCKDDSKQILTCDGGYYLQSQSDQSCSPAGNQQFSVNYDTERENCPLLDTDPTNIFASEDGVNDESEDCFQKNIWVDDHTGTTKGAYTKQCFWNSSQSSTGLAYNKNCGKTYEMKKCAAGFYDPHEGNATLETEAGCSEVEDGNWSPAPANWNKVIVADESIVINPCKGTEKYHGNASDDIDSSVTNPATGTRVASSESQCYLTCKAEKNIGGITYTNTDNNHHTLYSDGEYPTCRYNSTGLLCSVATNGAFDLPTSEVADINQCYRNCTTADIDGATGVSGTVTYTGTRTCTATSCDDEHCIAAGSNGNICIPKPANGTCTNNPEHPITCNEGYHLNDDETDCVPNEITLHFANGGHGTAPTSPNKCTYGQRFTMPAAMTAVDGYEFDKWSASNNNFEARASVVCNKANLGVASGTATITAKWKQCETGYYCDGNGGDNGKHKCPTEWPYSEPGATQSSQCYRNCDGGTARDGCVYTPIPGHEKAYYDAVCQYNATLDGDPAEYNPNTDSCTKTGCPQGEQLVNGECEPCDYPDNVLSYVPDQGCKVESCIVGYHPVNDHCEPDVEECTPDAPDSEYAEHKWIATRGAWGICEIKSCKEGFHLIANSCVADVQTCEIEHGTAQKEWNPRTGQFGPCIATSCVPGYTNDPYEKNDASKQCSECRNMYSTLGEVAASSYTTGCEIASCYYQGEKYNLDKGLNECVPICSPTPCRSLELLAGPRSAQTEYSDETGWMCWDEGTKKCKRTCNPGYMSW